MKYQKILPVRRHGLANFLSQSMKGCEGLPDPERFARSPYLVLVPTVTSALQNASRKKIPTFANTDPTALAYAKAARIIRRLNIQKDKNEGCWTDAARHVSALRPAGTDDCVRSWTDWTADWHVQSAEHRAGVARLPPPGGHCHPYDWSKRSRPSGIAVAFFRRRC